jgi:hypothetical protein
LRYKYTKLLKAVHCARQEWGEAKHHHCWKHRGWPKH